MISGACAASAFLSEARFAASMSPSGPRESHGLLDEDSELLAGQGEFQGTAVCVAPE